MKNISADAMDELQELIQPVTNWMLKHSHFKSYIILNEQGGRLLDCNLTVINESHPETIEIPVEN